jgi:hypothetical protein
MFRLMEYRKYNEWKFEIIDFKTQHRQECLCHRLRSTGILACVVLITIISQLQCHRIMYPLGARTRACG